MNKVENLSFYLYMVLIGNQKNIKKKKIEKWFFFLCLSIHQAYQEGIKKRIKKAKKIFFIFYFFMFGFIIKIKYIISSVLFYEKFILYIISKINFIIYIYDVAVNIFNNLTKVVFVFLHNFK